MVSWLKCKCGNPIHKNLFCGTGISLLATEEFLDKYRKEQSAEGFISELILRSSMLLKCKSCGRLVVLKEGKDTNSVEFYVPEKIS